MLNVHLGICMEGSMVNDYFSYQMTWIGQVFVLFVSTLFIFVHSPEKYR